MTTDSTFPAPFWMISVGAYATADIASAEVAKLIADGKQASYLWIPDYRTLSGKKLYSVFLGPYYTEFEAGRNLKKYKDEFPGAYAVKANHEGYRYSLYSSFDIRKDDKKMGMVILYATPADMEAYANEGGEDWGWFVNDVGEFMASEMSDVYYGVTLYDSWFSKEEIAAIEKELDLSGFGYIMINGNEKSFVSHDVPESIMAAICEFYGKEYNPEWRGGE
jgi:hypothetical protein